MRADPGNIYMYIYNPTSVTHLVEGLAEIVREKSIEQGIDAGARISHCMGHNLHDDAQQRG